MGVRELSMRGLAMPSVQSVRAPRPDLRKREPREDNVQGRTGVPATDVAVTIAPKKVAEKLDAAMSSRNMRLKLDAASNRMIVQVLNEDKEVVRTIPPEEVLEFSERFRQLQAVLFDKQA